MTRPLVNGSPVAPRTERDAGRSAYDWIEGPDGSPWPALAIVASDTAVDAIASAARARQHFKPPPRGNGRIRSVLLALGIGAALAALLAWKLA